MAVSLACTSAKAEMQVEATRSNAQLAVYLSTPSCLAQGLTLQYREHQLANYAAYHAVLQKCCHGVQQNDAEMKMLTLREGAT